MLASVIRSPITDVASAVCSDRVALASVASLAWAVAALCSIVRRTSPHRSGAQLTLPSSDPELFTGWKLPNRLLTPLFTPPLVRLLVGVRCRVTEPVTPMVGNNALRATRTSARASW